MSKLPRPAGPRPPHALIEDLLRTALALHQAGRGGEAAPLYEQVLAREPGQPAANHLLGLVRLQQGRADDAVRLITRAVAGNGRDPQYLGNLGAALNAAGRAGEAVAAFDRAIALRPGFAEAWSNRGMALRTLRRHRDAIDSYAEAIRLKPLEPGFHFNFGNVLADAGDLLAAEASQREALRLRANYPAASFALAEVLEKTGRAAEAVALLDAAIARAPGEPRLHYRRGRALYLLDRLPEAAASHRSALALQPAYGEAQCLLAQMVRHEHRDAEIAAMQQLAGDASASPDDRIFAGFGLGKALADLGEHEHSIAAFEAANRMHRSRLDYSLEPRLAQLASEPRRFEAIPAVLEGAGYRDAAPIFVVGLPRSGKSTVESIVRHHPLVYGAGELPTFPRLAGLLREDLGAASLAELPPERFAALGRQYMDEIAALVPAGRVPVDTMPPNFREIGFIRLALPNARIVHCRRPPIEHRIAIFEKYLTGAGYEYASDLDELGRYQAAYLQLMAHWRRLFPGAVHDIDIADLAANRPAGIRQLLEFCGLAFDSACLAEAQSEPQLGDWSPTRAAANRAAHLDAWRTLRPELWR